MPIGPFEDFEECVNYITEEEGYDEETARRICGSMEQENSTGFKKEVEIKEKDSRKQIATGIVLEPYHVDKQGDWLTPEGIENMFSEEVDHGVMHSVFPDDHSKIVRNEVIEEPEKIGGQEFPAGTWVVSRKYKDDDLWNLVEEGVLNGFSMGGSVGEQVEYSIEDLPSNVTVPSDYDGSKTHEIVDGNVREISDVDIPAVPRATYSEIKMKLKEKNLLDEVDGKLEFIDLMEERGHDPNEAEKLWNYLTRVDKEIKLDQINNPKSIKRESENERSEDIMTEEEEEEEEKSLRDKFVDWLLSQDDNTEKEADGDLEELKEKVGRTLSQDNIEALMSAHDAIERSLSNELDFRGNQFTKNPNYDFDIADYKFDLEGLEKTEEDDDSPEEKDEVSEEEKSEEEEGEDGEEEKDEDPEEEKEEKNEDPTDKLSEKFDEILEEKEELEEKVEELEEMVEKLIDHSVKSGQVPSEVGDKEDRIQEQKRKLFTK